MRETRPGRRDPRRLRQGRLILVIGGASSGKSAVALELAVKGVTRGMARAFVATGQALDDEMAQKIQRHRVSRGAGWDTEEIPVDLVAWFQKNGPAYRTIVLDCLTLWLSNLRERGVPDDRVPELVSALVQAIRATATRVVVITNELGLGLVPMEASDRRFRDLAGQVNQQVAAEADAVYFVMGGLPARIK